jgi:MoxR-like ATPase
MKPAHATKEFPMNDISSQNLPQKMIDAVEVALRGKREVIELAVCAFLAGGHVLIEDVPGVGKTTLAKSIVRVFEGVFRRIQFTSDMLPSDIIGVSIWDAERRQFQFQEGPLFANLVLADEINRASPRTQSALLEAMSENQVTVDGVTRKLPTPFMVIATQNITRDHGTYPLPESQMDRFFMRFGLGYADPVHERRMIQRKTLQDETLRIAPVVTDLEVQQVRRQVDEIFVEDSIVEYILELVTRTRTTDYLSTGVGPRGGMALHRCARAMAVIRGRDFVIVDDVRQLVVPVLSHRLVLQNDFGREPQKEQILRDIVASMDVPV